MINHAAPGARDSARLPTPNGVPPGTSSQGITRDTLIGSDPDLGRPLVPCDALGTDSHDGGRPTMGAFAPGDLPTGSSRLGYDPVTGISAIEPPVAGCMSMLSTRRDDAGVGDRDSSVYEQLTPDVNGGGFAGGRPGTLTLLRAFAN